jgi:outer membrane protein
MKRGARALLLAGLAGSLIWSTGADDQGLKIGVVDLQQAMFATDEGKAVKEELQRKRREAQQQLQPEIDRLKRLQEELEGKKYVLSEEALFAKQADMLELRNKIEAKGNELEGQLKIDQGRRLAPLQTRVAGVIEEIGKQQGFTLILARDTPGVIYSREALDITNQVIERFNDKKG